MEGGLAPTAAIQSCTALAMNAGPCSERMCRATPRRMNRSASASMTSMAWSRRETPMARHSWVNSSLMLSMRSLPPSWVIMGALLDEVVGPHVIAVLGPESDAGAVVQPETTALRLPGGHLQPRASPDPLDPLVVEEPAGPAQQRGDLAVAGAAVRPGQFDDVGGQPLFSITALRDLALRRAMLGEGRSRAELRA